MKIKKSVITIVVAASVFLVGAQAVFAVDDFQAVATDTGGLMLVDICAARPLGLAATIGGAAVFIVSSPFSALGGNLGPAFKATVVDPFTYTFCRPLGMF